MISYYDLLTMIKEKREPKEIVLQLNCGTRAYIPEYDGGEFFLYKLKNEDLENEDFHYYLSDTLLESQMFDECIEIIEETKKIEKIDIKSDEATPNSFYIVNNNGIKCYMTKHSKVIASKLNEIIDYINGKENSNE